MKVYVIPTEQACNGKCDFCISKFRRPISSEFLDPTKLEKLEKFRNIDQIEITGGGEPCLNPRIDEIIEKCLKISKTRIYTNGTLNSKNKNIEICISRIHYDDGINEKLMGIKYDIEKFSKIRISNFSKKNFADISSGNHNYAKFSLGKYKSFDFKLSLMLHGQGINSAEEIENYLNWAKKKNAKKVVIRKIAFNNRWESYENARKNNVLISNKDIERIKQKFGEFVEFDLESCNTNNSNIIMRADGNFYFDWDSCELIGDDEFLLAYLKKVSLTSSCLGRKVSSIIVKDGRILGIGSNSGSDCLRKKVCNRILTGKNEDYSNCLCNHAEVSAIEDALRHRNTIENSKIFLYGHYRICDHCEKIMKLYNLEWEVVN